MTIRDIISLLDAEIISAADLDLEVKTACGSDMMSDVLAFVKDQSVLLTEPSGSAHCRNDGYAVHRVCPGKAAGRQHCGAGEKDGHYPAENKVPPFHSLRKAV